MKFILCFLCIVLASTTVFSQEIDSTLVRLKNDVEKASNEDVKIKALLAIGEYQVEREFNQAEQYFLDAEKIIESCKDKHEDYLAFIYMQLGVVNRRKANYSQAISFYLKSKNIYEELKDTTNIADVIHNIGVVYRYQNEDGKAVENFKKAIQLNRQVKDTFGMAAGYNMIGVSYRRLKKIDSALLSYKKAKELFIQLRNEEDIRGVNNNMATLYAIQKQYDKSLPIKLDNLNYYKKVGNKMSTCVGYYNVSRDYSGLKEYNIALKYADSSLTIALKEGFKERISKAYLRKSGIYRNFENFKEAYRNYRLFKRYSDSIFNIESIKKIQELELKYEFEKERKELEFLTSEQKSRVKFYIFLFVLALLLGGLVGYLLRRNYKARAKIASDKFEKEKLKKELLDQKIKVSESELKSLIADNSMRLEFIKELSSQLKEDKNLTKSKDIQQYTQSLILKLQQQIVTENKLTSLQNKIEEVNIGFNSKLMELYPSLTKTEREVCALLRLNLSIKEISSIRNTTIDAVKALRYRIRKKLKVASGIELEKFVQSL
jgi:tetratricopeptide (TPR) repeat protein/DNA-binding CsgD family transcriptional regulator